MPLQKSSQQIRQVHIIAPNGIGFSLVRFPTLGIYLDSGLMHWTLDCGLRFGLDFGLICSSIMTISNITTTRVSDSHGCVAWLSVKGLARETSFA